MNFHFLDSIQCLALDAAWLLLDLSSSIFFNINIKFDNLIIYQKGFSDSFRSKDREISSTFSIIVWAIHEGRFSSLRRYKTYFKVE